MASPASVLRPGKPATDADADADAGAAAAIQHALDQGLVVQWRSGVRKHAFRRLGLRFGAVPLDEQFTVNLTG